MGGNLPTPDPAPVGRQPALRRLPVQVAAAQRALPRNVRALSWVSFANDAASELAYPVVPLFLTVTLGAPVAVVGLIEGIAEGIAVGLRGLSGWLSDRWGERRLPWVTGGYAGSAAGRVVIAAAPAWGWVLVGRVVDRLGKGARTAPRDALIRDSTPEPLLGAAFGYHRALDTAGAVGGPLTAVVLLAIGLVMFALVYLGFATAPGSWAVWPLFALYGVYIAATDGVARAWIADRVPGRAIGTAYGVFSAATGAALLVASIAAGLLWSHVSPTAPFVVGAAAAALAFLLLVLSSPMRAQAARPRDAQPQP